MVESILRLGKPAGELGPSTIVGSAAYNLMMISAVCTAALPTGEQEWLGSLPCWGPRGAFSYIIVKGTDSTNPSPFPKHSCVHCY